METKRVRGDFSQLEAQAAENQSPDRSLDSRLGDDAPVRAPSESDNFFKRLDELARTSPVVVERPAGSSHPRSPSVVYPIDYGALEGTTSTDGAGVDVFVGSEPGRGIIGVVLTVDLVKSDVEVKVLMDCSDADRDVVLDFLADGLGIGGHWVARPS